MFEENNEFFEPPIPENFELPPIPDKVFSFQEIIEDKEEDLDVKISKKLLVSEVKGLVNESVNFFKNIVKNNSEWKESVEYLKDLHNKINMKVDLLEKAYIKNKINKLKIKD
ncbi:hypothetical protein TUBRATIS_10480 [Tubulinosema ratisbonensis]|uniref:Uncharacterized protein n=1 Tax=Tubulinosema ratisbonensis TaxID=291195 RepID=A0A437AML5_9MICR|nr:hypothetical protein TUBRATIS_10480 [Tubulinosema ratisbonensis]